MEQVGNKTKEQNMNFWTSEETNMLTFALTVLFTLTGLIAVAVVADCLIKAHAAYAQLMREGEVMRAGLALQASAVEMGLRSKVAPRRAVATRRPGTLRQPMLPFGAAA
jgi:hypothetical protein